MNKESKLKARRTKLGKCSKEELVERIIRKDTEVSKLIAKNKTLNKELFEAEEVLNDTKKHYENKVKFLEVDYDEVVEKNLSLQKRFQDSVGWTVSNECSFRDNAGCSVSFIVNYN